jgi:hypothetical protein
VTSLQKGGPQPGLLVFSEVPEAEEIFHNVQIQLTKRLSHLKCQFSTLVRDLANKSRLDHFASLRDTIQKSIIVDMQPELKEEIIDELIDLSGVNVQEVMFSTIKRKIVRTIATRHTPATAFRAIEAMIAKPLVKANNDAGAGSDDGDISVEAQKEFQSGSEQLGFMFRGPIAVIASIPWVLGAGIWPFMVRVSSRFSLHVVVSP